MWLIAWHAGGFHFIFRVGDLYSSLEGPPGDSRCKSAFRAPSAALVRLIEPHDVAEGLECRDRVAPQPGKCGERGGQVRHLQRSCRSVHRASIAIQ